MSDENKLKRAARGRLVCFGLWLALANCALADGQTKVSIEATQRSLREVVSDLAQQAKVEVSYLPGVGGVVSARISKVPFDDALRTVLNISGYAWRREGGTYVIGRFGAQVADPASKTAVVTLNHPIAATLARSFGWLDLAALASGGAVADLRHLLPVGLDGPPRPTSDGRGLEVSGSATAIGDFRSLIKSLDRSAAQIEYRWLLATVSADVIDELRVPWAQGPMIFGSTNDDRELYYTATDLDAQWARLTSGLPGLTVLGRGTLQAPDLAVVRTDLSAPISGHLALAGRVEEGLTVRLYADCQALIDGQPLSVTIENGFVPTSEGALVVSRKIPGRTGPESVLLVVIPTATPGDES